MTKTIDDLDQNILLEISKFLTPKEIAKNLSPVSKKLHAAAHQQLLWQLKTKIHFPQVYRIYTTKKNVNWRLLFIKNFIDEYQINLENQYFFNSSKTQNMISAKEGRLNEIVPRAIDNAEILYWAAVNKHQHILNYFFNDYKQKNNLEDYFEYDDKNEESQILIKDETKKINYDQFLAVAIKCNQPKDMIVKLIQQGANINPAPNERHNYYDQTPLHLAAQMGNVEIVKTLIDLGAQINLQDNSEKSVLVIAIENDQREVVYCLLEHGAELQIPLLKFDPSTNTFSNQEILVELPLYAALISANKNLVELLMKKGASFENLLKQCPVRFVYITMDLNILFRKLVTQNEIELLKLLIKHVDINAHDTTIPKTALLIACIEGYEEMVRFLLDNGANFMMPGCDNRGKYFNRDSRYMLHLPLFIAIKYGHVEIIKNLLQKGAKIEDIRNHKDEDGLTSLHYAAQNGDLYSAELLLNHQADIDGCDSNHNTPLKLAVAARKFEMVKFLLAQGANYKIASYDRNHPGTPLFTTIMSGEKDIFEELQNYGASIGKEIHPALCHQTVLRGDLEMMTYLLSQGADPNMTDGHGKTSLMISIESGHLPLVKLLLLEKSHYSLEQQNLYLCIAIRHGHLDILKHLIASEFPLKNIINDPAGLFYNYPYTPLQCAAMNGDVEMAEFLINNGAQIDVQCTSSNLPPLLYAAMLGHKEVFELLVRYGAELFVPKEIVQSYFAIEGYSLITETKQADNERVDLLKFALILAIKNNHKSIIDAIFSLDKNLLNQVCCYKFQLPCTPIYIAVLENNLDAVENLIDHGAIIDDQLLILASMSILKNDVAVKLILGQKLNLNVSVSESFITNTHNYFQVQKGFKPIHIASIRNAFSIIKALLKSGVAIDEMSDVCKNTALHFAIKNDRTELTEFLIKRGANVNAINAKGQSPLLLAIKNRDKSLIKLLLKFNAKLDLVFNYMIADPQAIKFLAEIIQINTPISHGNTLLHIAALTNNLGQINFLLANHANVCALNDAGQKPSEVTKHKLVLLRLELAEYKKKLIDKAKSQQQVVSQKEQCSTEEFLPKKTKPVTLFGLTIKKAKEKASLQSKLAAVNILEKYYFNRGSFQNMLKCSETDIFKKSKKCRYFNEEIEKELSKVAKDKKPYSKKYKI